MGNHQPVVSAIDEAAWRLLECKRLEDEARQNRISAEESVIALVGLAPEGTQTEKTQYFKVSTVSNLNRSLVPNGEDIIEAEGERYLDKIVRYRPEVSVSGLKALASQEPEVYARIIKAIITKPAKPSVKVEQLGAQ